MIQFRNTIACEHRAISNHVELVDFSEAMRNAKYHDSNSEEIFIWNGFGRQVPSDFFENSTWQQNFVGLFRNQDMWPWKFRFSRTGADQLGNKILFEALGGTQKDVLASLRIRAFESEDDFQGSLEWFENIDPYLDNEYFESRMLIGHIIHSLRAAQKVGVRLYLEKISLMVSHDPNNSVTLTPHLHRDGAYGHLESAIISFYAERRTPNASTLFFPDFDFDAASHLKPITSEILERQFPNAYGYSVASGSLAIFSGKLGRDGSKSDSRGALHISPEGFFPTRRLVLLFRSKISF